MRKRTLWSLYCVALLGLCLLIRNFYGFVHYQSKDNNIPLPASSLSYYDYKGIIHCHSTYSGDAGGDFPEIISDAQSAGIDYLIMSDHNTFQPYRDGWEGWHKGLLLLVGDEISTKTGHLLTMNINQEIPNTTPQEVIDGVNANGGLSFLAHPENMKIPWRDRSVQNYTGIEIINMDSVIRRKAVQIDGIFSLLAFLQSPYNLSWVVAHNPPSHELKLWDELTKERRVVGLTSVDAHSAIKIGDTKYRKPSYEDTFRTANTHIITKEQFSGQFINDKKLLYQAIAAGHVYGVFETVAPGAGFMFWAKNANEQVLMGDEIKLTSGSPVMLSVTLPPGEEGIIRLVQNGIVIQEIASTNLSHAVTEPGVYRVEVYHYDWHLPFDLYWGSKPWIYSNPIYVK